MNIYAFSGTLSFFMICLMPFGFSTFIEIQNISITLPSKLVSIISSFLVMGILFFFIYSILIISFKGYTHAFNDRYIAKYASILNPVKKTHMGLMYYPLYNIKRFVQIVFTVLFLDNTQAQTLIIGISQILFFLYILAFRPFISKYNNIMAIISGVFTSILTLYSVAFANSDNNP
jgi:hypothetical protein